MALKTSLVISGDAGSAVSALKEAEKGAKQLADAMARADEEIDRLAKAQATANKVLADAKAQYQAGEVSLDAYNAQVLETRTALSLFEGSHRNAVNALKQSQNALRDLGPSAGQAQAAYTNLGRQMQDVAVMAQGGMNLGTIISTQGGQIADAVAQMGGRFAGLASFLSGPWGAGLIVGTGLLVNFAEEMFKAGKETDKTKNANETLAEKLSLQKHSLEEVTQAMREYNREQAKSAQTTLESARAAWIAAQGSLNEALAIRTKLSARLAEKQIFQNASAGQGTGGAAAAYAEFQVTSTSAALAENEKKISVGQEALRNATGAWAEQVAKVATNSKYAIEEGFKAKREAVKAAGGDLASMSAKLARLDVQENAALEKLNRHRTKKGPDAAAIARSADNFEDDTSAKISKIGLQYSNLPSEVQKANASLIELRSIQQDIERRAEAKGGKLINVAALEAQIDTVRAAIEGNLNKPLNDYLQKADEGAQVDKLLANGRDDEAAALKVIYSLQDKMNPLTTEQTEKVLQTVAAQRQHSMVLRDQRALLQANVQAASSMRSSLNETVADAMKGRFSFDKILSSVGNSYVNVMSGRIVESMFGDSLRAFEDEATRNFRAATDTTATQIARLGDAVAQTTDKFTGVAGGAGSSELSSLDQFFALVKNKAAVDDGITVTANKASSVAGVASPMLGQLSSVFKGMTGFSLPSTLLNGMKPVFSRLEKVLPDALQGAFTGSAASKLILGSGGNSIGAGIGGAIGETMGKKFLTAGLSTLTKGLGDLGQLAGPLGGIVGGLLGGALGNLFQTTKAGTTVLSGSGKASTSASSADVAAGLSNMGNSIQSALAAVASKFATTVGDFSVSIGQYKDYFRVSASGSSSVGDKYYPNNAGSDILYDGTDQSTAVLIAIQNAISDGAIKGLSSAVQKALSSSTNIENAVAEALKVQETELAIGGIGATMAKSFREAETTAAERLRIARQYGFDIAAVEKVNAEARIKLQNQLLKDQVGSLQQLVDEMVSGSLFEGSAVDQRTAILAKIDAAKADVTAGKEGASDTLAQLLEKLNTISKDAFGSTGAYAADRQMITDTARDTIAAANKTVLAAQAAVPAVTDTAAQIDESNDFLSQISETLKSLDLSVTTLKALASGSGSDLAALRAAAAF
jgi:hypothetical protein